jgi:hypothetical protein
LLKLKIFKLENKMIKNMFLNFKGFVKLSSEEEEDLDDAYKSGIADKDEVEKLLTI